MRYLFARVDEKRQFLGNFEKILEIFEENSIEKMIFLLFLERLLLNIEPWKITPDFYNNFSLFRGGAFPCSPPPFPAPMERDAFLSQNYNISID